MAKTILKEIFIIFLITLAVGLVLALIFYQYIPTNRIVPSKVTAYATPEEVAKEIEDASQEELEGENKVFTITDADLALYRSERSYNPGKVNPFAKASSATSEQGSGQTTPSEGGTSPNVDANTTDNYYTASGVGSGTK